MTRILCLTTAIVMVGLVASADARGRNCCRSNACCQSGCAPAVAAAPGAPTPDVASTAQAQGVRSMSVDAGTAAPTYYAGRRVYRMSTPTYELPKSDARRFSTGSD